jgi:hypothetical protein
MARLAVSAEATGAALVARKLFERLHGLAVGAAPEAFWSLERCTYFTSMLFEHAFAVAFL